MVAVKNNYNQTISAIVRSDYRTADVFKKHGINFCCGGEVFLEIICQQKGLNYDDLVKELNQATRSITLSNAMQFNNWKTDFLVDYMINVHHAYVSQALPGLEAALAGFVGTHSKKQPELLLVYEVFQELSASLLTHNKYEEEIIFPYIKQLENAYRRNEPYATLFVKTLRKPLSNIKSKQNNISDLLTKLRSLTNHYQFPQSACTNHQVIYRKLQELDADLVQHMHLENNILFPKAIEMEQQLLQL